MYSQTPFSEPDDDNILDEYVVGIQNPTQLTSSLALLLKERNYVVLYDTSIISSPENHLKKTSLEQLKKDFLYKWYLFFTGLYRNIETHDNLIVLPEVADEICKLISATIFAIDKRKNQYKSLSPKEKYNLQDIFEQLVKNETILGSLLQKLESYKTNSSPVISSIFDALLELIKCLDDSLHLKKLDSRETNDTDERIAARTFYELLINNRNVAVYTRDDDVRKLISASFKWLLSKHINKNGDLKLLKKLSFHNILVFKYNYEEKVYSRFFESSTLSHLGDFRLPPHLNQNKRNQMVSTTHEITEQIEEYISQLEQEQRASVPEREAVVPLDPRKALEDVLDIFSSFSLAGPPIKVCESKIHWLEKFLVVTKAMGHAGLEEQIQANVREHKKTLLEYKVMELEKEGEQLRETFRQLSALDKPGVNWPQIQTAAQAGEENSIKTRFYKAALEYQYYNASEEHFEQFKHLIKRFQQEGFNIGVEEKIPIPTDKIRELSECSTNEIIRTIEGNRIRHQGTHAYLDQGSLIHFLKY